MRAIEESGVVCGNGQDLDPFLHRYQPYGPGLKLALRPIDAPENPQYVAEIIKTFASSVTEDFTESCVVLASLTSWPDACSDATAPLDKQLVIIKIFDHRKASGTRKKYGQPLFNAAEALADDPHDATFNVLLDHLDDPIEQSQLFRSELKSEIGLKIIHSRMRNYELLLKALESPILMRKLKEMKIAPESLSQSQVEGLLRHHCEREFEAERGIFEHASAVLPLPRYHASFHVHPAHTTLSRTTEQRLTSPAIVMQPAPGHTISEWLAAWSQHSPELAFEAPVGPEYAHLLAEAIYTTWFGCRIQGIEYVDVRTENILAVWDPDKKCFETVFLDARAYVQVKDGFLSCIAKDVDAVAPQTNGLSFNDDREEELHRTLEEWFRPYINEQQLSEIRPTQAFRKFLSFEYTLMYRIMMLAIAGFTLPGHRSATTLRTILTRMRQVATRSEEEMAKVPKEDWWLRVLSSIAGDCKNVDVDRLMDVFTAIHKAAPLWQPSTWPAPEEEEEDTPVDQTPFSMLEQYLGPWDARLTDITSTAVLESISHFATIPDSALSWTGSASFEPESLGRPTLALQSSAIRRRIARITSSPSHRLESQLA